MAFCSFGALLICHRLIHKNKNRKGTRQELIESVSNIEQGQRCIDILLNDKFNSLLVDKIRKLIKLNQISILLNKLIERFPNEYKLLLSLRKKESYYESLFWDNGDLVSFVFQYLNLETLNNCSNVNFLWCIHSFSINSIYYLDLTILCNLKDCEKERIWQRFIKAKSVFYNSWHICQIGFKPHEITQTFIDNYSTLKSIERLRMKFRTCTQKRLVPFLQAVGMTSNKLKEFELHFSDFNWMDKHERMNRMKNIYNELATIDLTRCHKVALAEMAIPFAISNECRELVLNVVDISDKWCQNLINEGAFQCVETLKIKDISFDKKNNKDSKNSQDSKNSKNSKKNVATKLAKSFSNINLFQITNIVDDDSYVFWSSISNNLIKNNGVVKLCLSHGYEYTLMKHKETLAKSMTKLTQFISNNIHHDNRCIKRIQIFEINIGEDVFSKVQQLLLLKQIESNIEFFEFTIGWQSSFKKLTHWWNQINEKIEKEKIYQFSSFKCMKTSTCFSRFNSLIPINDYLKARLRWNQLNQLKNNNNYCIYNNFEIFHCQCKMYFEKKEFLSHFEQILTLLSKFVELKIPIDLHVEFRFLNYKSEEMAMKKHFEKIYDTMFITKMQPFIPNGILSQYKYFAHENEYCKFSPNGPTIEFVWKDVYDSASLNCQTAIENQNCL